jgi:LPXTG-site transpeptidase (sortase) family protein
MSKRSFTFILVFLILVVYLYSAKLKHLFDSSKNFEVPINSSIIVEAETIIPDIPNKISIPSIGLESQIDPVGLTADNLVDVPQSNVGWYNMGAKPGETGTAALDGHFKDFKFGPGVFYRLSELQVGSDIYIKDISNKEFHYKVVKNDLVNTDRFPTNQVYGHSSKPLLNLVTCAGNYDHAKKDFDKRTIVYSELVN